MTTHTATLARPSSRVGRRSALAGLFLPFSLILPFVIMIGVAAVLGPAHNMQIEEPAGALLALGLIMPSLSAGGALWGRALSRIAGVGRAGRMALAGAVGNLVMTLLATRALGLLEFELVERGNTTLPVHVVFTLLFVPATFVVATVLSGAALLAGGAGRASFRAALLAGAAAALAFLALNVLQDVVGRRVGGPDAGATATMITVLLIGNLGSAAAGSAVVGRALAGRAR